MFRQAIVLIILQLFEIVILLNYGVMVTHKILVLGFLVRVQMVQLQQNAIDIKVLTNATEKYNKLREELTILNSYKTIFGID